MTDRVALAALSAEIVECRRCPRLVEWRERVAVEKVARFRDEPYWGRPLPGFGDPDGRILIIGLAPAAHGGNRTGRVFTGDKSGDFLWAALHGAGLADRASSRRADDGLTLTDAYIAAAVRCAPPLNKPTNDERDACAPFLAREIALLTRAAGHPGTRHVRLGRGAPGAPDPRPPSDTEAAVRARRVVRGGPVPARRVVPPEPAEHVHRPPDGPDVRCGDRAGGGRRGRLTSAYDRGSATRRHGERRSGNHRTARRGRHRRRHRRAVRGAGACATATSSCSKRPTDSVAGSAPRRTATTG